MVWTSRWQRRTDPTPSVGLRFAAKGVGSSRSCSPGPRACPADADRQSPTVPTRSPDETFHYLVTELLRDCQQRNADRSTVLTLVDQRWSPRSYQVRDLLQRGGLPFAFHSADSPEGQALLREVGRAEGKFPVLVRYDRQVLTDPANEQIAYALGVRHASAEGIFDEVLGGLGAEGVVPGVPAQGG
jgi:thioredoxin reductase (NADPH)